MRIGGHDYETIAIIDNQNNLLCAIRDNQAICVDKLRIIAEEEPNKLAFVSMENSTTKCFVRQDDTVLPAGAMTSTNFFKSNTVQDTPEETDKVLEKTEESSNVKEETEAKEKEKIEEKTEEQPPLPNISPDAKVIPGEVGKGAEFLKNMPPEAISAIMKAMMSRVPKDKKSETAEAIAKFEEQLAEEQKKS